jgi:hypothetical protein
MAIFPSSSVGLVAYGSYRFGTDEISVVGTIGTTDSGAVDKIDVIGVMCEPCLSSFFATLSTYLSTEL